MQVIQKFNFPAFHKLNAFFRSTILIDAMRFLSLLHTSALSLQEGMFHGYLIGEIIRDFMFLTLARSVLSAIGWELITRLGSRLYPTMDHIEDAQTYNANVVASHGSSGKYEITADGKFHPPISAAEFKPFPESSFAELDPVLYGGAAAFSGAAFGCCLSPNIPLAVRACGGAAAFAAFAVIHVTNNNQYGAIIDRKRVAHDAFINTMCGETRVLTRRILDRAAWEDFLFHLRVPTPLPIKLYRGFIIACHLLVYMRSLY